MNRIDKQINDLFAILEKQEWNAIEVEIVGTITIKMVLYKPQYSLIKERNCIQLYDNITDKRVIIDIVVATEIIINEQIQEYIIELDNDQNIKMKMY